MRLRSFSWREIGLHPLLTGSPKIITGFGEKNSLLTPKALDCGDQCRCARSLPGCQHQDSARPNGVGIAAAEALADEDRRYRREERRGERQYGDKGHATTFRSKR